MDRVSEEGREDQVQKRIDYFIKQIDRNNGLLLTIAQAGLERFLKDKVYFSAGCFLLQGSVGSCINLGLHIIAANGFRKPESYSEIFEILAAEKIIPHELAEKLGLLVSLRNKLVNLDPELDALAIFDAIRHNLPDIIGYQKAVLGHLRPMR